MTQNMKWLQRQRALYILGQLTSKGEVGRGKLVEHFGCSLPTASAILTKFRESYPEAAVYDVSLKTYIPGKKLAAYWRDAEAETPAEQMAFD
jgi:hypothetical protein